MSLLRNVILHEYIIVIGSVSSSRPLVIVCLLESVALHQNASRKKRMRRARGRGMKGREEGAVGLVGCQHP